MGHVQVETWDNVCTIIDSLVPDVVDGDAHWSAKVLCHQLHNVLPVRVRLLDPLFRAPVSPEYEAATHAKSKIHDTNQCRAYTVLANL